MINIRKIYNLDFNSSFIRSILSVFYRSGRYYRIPFGPLRGIKIWYDSSINFHAILGIWEKHNFSALRKVLGKILEKQEVIYAYDIGANIGLYSLYFSKYGGRIKTIAFEPVKDTIINLQNNLAKNNVLDILIVDKAVSNIDGEVTFYLGHHHKSSLEKEWTSDRGTRDVQEISVPSVRLDSFVARNPAQSPNLIKIDVEGGGAQVLEGVVVLLKSKRPIILIESHTAHEDAAIIKVLRNFNYKAYRTNNKKWIQHPESDYMDPDGVWGTMFLFPAEIAGDYFK